MSRGGPSRGGSVTVAEMARRLCAGTVCLLAALVLVATDERGHSEGALEQLLALVSRAVDAATAPVLAELANHRTLLLETARKLDSQDRRLDSLNSRLDSLSARLDASGQQCVRPEPAVLARDCSDLAAGARSGVHTLRLGAGQTGDPVEAFCDMGTDGGGWTVFQRRADILPREDFYRNWTDYREGFGELTAEFWWGLEKLWLVTAPLDRHYELRVDLEDFDGERRHAVYQYFGISSENDGYRVTGSNYTGNAGDSLGRHFGNRFSTRDRDQGTSDTQHCAQFRKGAWWYTDCHYSNLNGQYMSGKTAKDLYGVNWSTWRGYHYSLKTVEMKIRPKAN